jgi:hypothetical protein
MQQQLPEGTIRRSKRTGATEVFQGGQWIPQGGGAAPQPQGMPTEIRGDPKPVQTQTVGNQFGVVGGDGSFTPTYTAPPKPEKPKEPKGGDPVANARNLLTAAGVDLERGVDPVGDLIKGSTSGKLQALGAQAYGAVTGDATDGMENIGKLQTIASDLTLQLTGGSLGSQISNADREFIVQRVGNIGDPNVPADQRLAAWEQVKERMGNIVGIKPPAPALTDEQLDAEMKRKIANRESPAEIIKWMIANNQPIHDETLAQITANLGNPNPRVIRPNPNAEALKAGVGDLVEGAGDVVGLIGNPLNAGINWATGSNLSTDLGQSARDALGLPEGDPMAGAINQGGIAALSGAGLARGASSLFPKAAPYLSPLTPEPIRQGIAGAGAGAGTEAARQNNLGPAGQAAAGIASGIAGYGGANALMRLAQPKAASPVMQAAQAQNIRLRPADVSGSGIKRVDSASLQSPLSAGSVTKAARNTQDDIQAATGRAARSQGDALDIDDAGEAIRAAGKSYSADQGKRIGRVYDRAETRAQGVSIKPQQSLAFLDEQIARFKQAPQGDSIANGVSVSGMRDARSILSQGVYDGKLRSGLEKGLNKQFLGLLSKDIEAGLSVAGRKDALNLFKIADKAWSERIEYIDNVLEPVIGPKKSGEQVLEAVERMAGAKGGNAKRLSELLRELPPEQTGNIRATLIERLGKATAGQQNDTGDVFAASTFVTRWNGMSAKGKAVLFGNSELRQNLDQIAKVANATKETGRAANHSNTGTALNVIGLTGIGAVSPKAAITMGVVQLLAGRALASQALTRWIARIPANPQALQRHEGQLAQIAAREPIIANDVASIQQYLSSASQRAAAGSEDQPE